MNKVKIKKIILELGIIFLAFLIGYLAKENYFSQIGYSCIVREQLGILCPSCGGTRCIEALAKGSIYEAFLYHPIFFLTGVYLIIINIIFIMNIFSKKPIATCLYPKTKFWIGFIIALIIFTIVRNLFR